MYKLVIFITQQDQPDIIFFCENSNNIDEHHICLALYEVKPFFVI